MFEELPAHALLWVYAVDSPLTPATTEQVSGQLSHFMDAWQFHGQKVDGQFAFLYDRFILIAADISEAEISGCGIDASVHVLEETGQRLGFNLLSGLNVFYRDENRVVQSVSRSTFRKLVRSEEVTGETIVFDTSLVKLDQLREGLFELPAHDSWHAMVFRIPSPST